MCRRKLDAVSAQARRCVRASSTLCPRKLDVARSAVTPTRTAPRATAHGGGTHATESGPRGGHRPRTRPRAIIDGTGTGAWESGKGGGGTESRHSSDVGSPPGPGTGEQRPPPSRRAGSGRRYTARAPVRSCVPLVVARPSLCSSRVSLLPLAYLDASSTSLNVEPTCKANRVAPQRARARVGPIAAARHVAARCDSDRPSADSGRIVAEAGGRGGRLGSRIGRRWRKRGRTPADLAAEQGARGADSFISSGTKKAPHRAPALQVFPAFFFSLPICTAS